VYDDDDLVDEAAVGEKSKRSRKYSETLARRTAQGKARRVKERKRSIAPTLYWGYMRNGEQEVPDPETFVAAQRAWELGLAGNGASETSRILAAEGLPTRSPNRINEMWRSPLRPGPLAGPAPMVPQNSVTLRLRARPPNRGALDTQDATI